MMPFDWDAACGEVGHAYLRLNEAVLARSNAWAEESPETRRIKRLCLLLHARHERSDPDLMVMTTPATHGPNDTLLIRGELMPAWATYIRQAVEMVEVTGEADALETD